MQLNIESVKTNPSGKSLTVKAGGKDYFAKTDSGIQQGMMIEAETKPSEFKGKTNIWIEKWKPVAAAPGATQPQTIGTSGPNVTPWWMPFVSNITAHAIQAGIIQSPNQIEAWAVAARNAAHKLETDIPV